MRTFRCISLLLMMVLALTAPELQAQTSYEYLRNQILERQRDTRTQIESLDDQIERISERLSETSREYDEVYARFEELTKLVALQEERLRQMNREQAQIEEEITLIEQNLRELQRQLDALIEEYQSTLRYLYKHGRTTELALLFTSSSVNELLVRSFYLEKFNSHVEEQMAEIEAKQAELEQTNRELEQTRERNEEALVSIRRESESLEQQRQRQQQLSEELKEDVESLEQQKTLQEQQRDNLMSTMDRLIAEEERLRRAASSAAPGSEEARIVSAVSDEELALFGERFSEMKGNLPWPVDNGVITQRFGTRAHPVFGTRTQNLGVDIATLPESPVEVVSDGFVYNVQPLQGYGDMIFVNHGGYLTAYGNMSEIYVRRNQVLSKGEIIGLSGAEDSIRGPVLFFVIREGSQVVNPETWLQRSSP